MKYPAKMSDDEEGEEGEEGEEFDAPHWMFISDGNRITAEPPKETLDKTMILRLRDPDFGPPKL